MELGDGEDKEILEVGFGEKVCMTLWLAISLQ